jgi:hypothetical protein
MIVLQTWIETLPSNCNYCSFQATSYCTKWRPDKIEKPLDCPLCEMPTRIEAEEIIFQYKYVKAITLMSDVLDKLGYKKELG